VDCHRQSQEHCSRCTGGGGFILYAQIPLVALRHDTTHTTCRTCRACRDVRVTLVMRAAQCCHCQTSATEHVTTFCCAKIHGLHRTTSGGSSNFGRGPMTSQSSFITNAHKNICVSYMGKKCLIQKILRHGRRQRGGRRSCPLCLMPCPRLSLPSRREKKLYVPSRPFPSIVAA